MDIGCQIYQADQLCTSSAYSCSRRGPGLGGRSHRLDGHCPALSDEDGGRRRRGGQTAVDGMSASFDGGGCTAWVLSGRLNVSDIPGSSYRNDQQCEVVDNHKDARSWTYQRRSASPSDDLDPCPVFDVQRRAGVGRNDLIASHVRARLPDFDQHDGCRAHDAMTATCSQFYCAAPRPSGTSRQQWNYIEHQRQHDRSSPETLVSSQLDLRWTNKYNSALFRSGNPRSYDYSKIQNGRANGGGDVGAELRNTMCNGLQGSPDSGGVSGRVSPVERSNSTTVTSRSTSYDVGRSSSSRPDVAATVSPRLEAHELSLSCASSPLSAVTKTSRRRASTSSSSSSSSTPNIIRRHLKTIAQSLDAALGGGRVPAHVRSRTSRHQPVSTHRKLTLTRSNSEPEALDRVAGVHRKSVGDDEFGFSSSYPSYRVRALGDQRDDEPPSPTTFVGRASADGGGSGAVRSTVDDAVMTSKCSSGGKSSRSTTKTSQRLTGTSAGGRWTSFSMIDDDRTLPKLRRGWSESDGLLVTYPTNILQLTDDEQHELAKVAVLRLQVLDLPGVALALKRWTPRGDVGGHGAMEKLLRLKRYVSSGNAFESVGLREAGKDKSKSPDLIALPGGASKSQVFGVSLSKCLRHDAERNRRVPAAPSSESNLLDALSLSQSANISRRRMTSRPNADQLYDEHYCSTLLQVPHVVCICCRHLKTDGLSAPGIFRIAGSKSRVTMLRQEFDSGSSVYLTPEHSVHDVASLLKEYLRDLPEPLLTHQLFQAFLATAAIDDVNSRVSTLRLLVSLLPTVNRDTLWYLLTFLSCVAKHAEDQVDDTGQTVPGNKMDSSNLATVFGPNVLRQGKTGKFQMDGMDQMAQNDYVIAVVKDLIDFHAAVFRVTKELYNEVLDSLSESGTFSCELDVTPEAADISHRRVQLDTADSSEGSFRTSSSGCDAECPSSVLERSAGDSLSAQQLICDVGNMTSPDVTASSRSCRGNGDDCDWSSQRWRHWQLMTMMSSCETNEQQTLV